jgi:hypothetical protein
VLTLALTRNFGCMVGISRRPQARKLTPVRTTNGATPRSSRAYQQRRGLSARPGAIADIDAPTEAAASVEIVTRARHDARALVQGFRRPIGGYH